MSAFVNILIRYILIDDEYTNIKAKEHRFVTMRITISGEETGTSIIFVINCIPLNEMILLFTKILYNIII